jgi:EAL domain-containing protein (putative c-di-GMP-specific phosphodiesterase class I)
MAEETGLIVPIGWMVLTEVCERLAAWEREGIRSFFMSVNFSGRQFAQADFVNHVQRILESTGCDARRLRVELTETVLMETADSGVQKLRDLADLHVQLYIDDFGTGYSSLSYLHRLPTHAIKIDRSFVHQMTDSGGTPAIVGTIMSLAQNLGMRVEAEGIETPLPGTPPVNQGRSQCEPMRMSARPSRLASAIHTPQAVSSGVSLYVHAKSALGGASSLNLPLPSLMNNLFP